jgi:hypothetical protein
LVPEGKFTFAAAKLHIFLKQPNIFAMICPSLSLSQLISEKFANFLDGRHWQLFPNIALLFFLFLDLY